MTDAAPSPSPAVLARSAVPATLVGAGAAVLLVGIDELAHLLHEVWWSHLPDALGVDGDARWWAALILTLTGALVGLTLWKAPGHGGHDTATVELASPPLPLRTLPGVAVALVLGLAGGVSLGPEGPIIMVATGLTVVAYRRFLPAVPLPVVLMISTAAMLGAMLGTPVAAALVLTSVLGGNVPGQLWDRLFTPLVAAGAASVVYHLLGGASWDMGLPDYTAQWVDLLSASVIASVGAALGAAAAWTFTPAHRAFRRLRHPLLYVTVGGAVLGVLALIGGQITMFKGAEETAELLADLDSYTVGALALIVVVKLAAIVVSGASGFRGGRIFPAMFTGVALGAFAHALVPGIPLTLAVASGVLGVVFAVGRDGWLALFGGVLICGAVTVLPILCVAALPVWLVLTRAPHMLVHEEPAEASEPPAVPTR
ncbi:ion channel protein [Demequina sp. SYSU T00192]|uniref:Ion channel protein n=1 Tax=Demequina litoralis TaxID=3051660 RepID=A0ABT8GB65_9MICO|nr:ion channel protein [Demequina sp. SYSU T00192]MDN4476385.1 ion channel protein [Demequina sp. SYSU T00192]